MNSVERVKAICKDRKIPIYKLERDLGYANGYIGQLRKGIFPANRLAEIATYLSVSTEYLLNGTIHSEMPTPVAEDGHKNKNIIKIAGRDGSFQERQLTDEQLAALKAILSQMPDASDYV